MDGIKKIIPPEQVAFTTHITVESGKYIYIFSILLSSVSFHNVTWSHFLLIVRSADTTPFALSATIE